ACFTPDAGNRLMRALFGRLTALLVAIGLLLAFVRAGHAQSFEDALARFAADTYGATDAAIGAVAASGSPRAYELSEALQDGRLRFGPDDKRVYVKEPSGRIVDAVSGTPVAASATALKPVRINNRIRRTIDAALGSLSLVAADPGRRFEAAQAV